jgi:LPXTG-motif cell wall-anchored protein
MVLRSLIASLAIACVLAVPAAAQDEQALPDPSEPAAQQENGSLPSTGLSAAVLVTAGLALMAGGVAIAPAARRRRTYSSLAWRGAVASRARQG